MRNNFKQPAEFLLILLLALLCFYIGFSLGTLYEREQLNKQKIIERNF